MKEKLTYRDYIVHIFTGVIFNVFLLVVFWPLLPANWWQYDLQNSLIWSLAAIPILFLEGHFILAIDRFFMIELFKWRFICLVKRHRRKKEKLGTTTNKDSSTGQEPLSDSTPDNKRLRALLPRNFVEKHHHEFSEINCTEKEEKEMAPNKEIHYRIAAYKLRMKWYDELYKQCKWLFLLLFSARISGQKVIRKDKDGPLVKTKKEEKKALSTRYYVLSDFFKGICCASVIAGIISLCTANWWAAGAIFVVFVLSKQRERFYSMLYVKERYAKKKKEEDSAKSTTLNTYPNQTLTIQTTERDSIICTGYTPVITLQPQNGTASIQVSTNSCQAGVKSVATDT